MLAQPVAAGLWPDLRERPEVVRADRRADSVLAAERTAQPEDLVLAVVRVARRGDSMPAVVLHSLGSDSAERETGYPKHWVLEDPRWPTASFRGLSVRPRDQMGHSGNRRDSHRSLLSDSSPITRSGCTVFATTTQRHRQLKHAAIAPLHEIERVCGRYSGSSETSSLVTMPDEIA